MGGYLAHTPDEHSDVHSCACVIHARGTSNIPLCTTMNVSYTPYVQRCVCMSHTRLMCTAVYASYIHCATRAFQTYHVTFVSAAKRRALFGRSTCHISCIGSLDESSMSIYLLKCHELERVISPKISSK